MRHRPDMLDEQSPAGLEVVQLTDGELPAAHVYMEAQVFTPDSRRVIVHSPATAHPGGVKDHPEHRFLVCDLSDGAPLTPIIHEPGATSPSVSPDGEGVYYFVDETAPGRGRLTLKRVGIDGADRRTILAVDSPLPGGRRPSRLYPLSTISADGRRLAASAFLGDGSEEGAPFGLLVFDLPTATVRLVLEGPTWCNMHAQYCRSPEPAAGRDVLVQENHGCVCDAAGRIVQLTGGAGADVHVVGDDGQAFRTLPWGRDGVEFCQGHQCWRGRRRMAITSTAERSGPGRRRLIESPPADGGGHDGLATPGGRRNELSRSFGDPDFSHFGTDAAGRRLVTDCGPFDAGGRLFLAQLPDAPGEAVGEWTYLLAPRSSCTKDSHIHPFLSPDGSMAFFNSDESGALQAYMVRGW